MTQLVKSKKPSKDKAKSIGGRRTAQNPRKHTGTTASTKSGRAPDSSREVLIDRIVRGLGMLADKLSPEQILQALGERTDVSALARVLSEAAADLEALKQLDPTAEALLRGAEVKRKLLDEAGSFGTSDLVRLLNISQQAITKRIGRGTLLAVRTSSGELRLPAIQFTDEGTVPGLEKVLEAFNVGSPWTRLSVLLSRDPAVDNMRVIDALRRGNIEGALEAVSSYGAAQ